MYHIDSNKMKLKSKILTFLLAITTVITQSQTVLNARQGGTGIGTYTLGDLLYASSSNTLTKLGIGSSNQVLSVIGGVPTWTNVASGGTWGSITGTLSNQTDLNTALNARLPLSGGTMSGNIIFNNGLYAYANNGGYQSGIYFNTSAGTSLIWKDNFNSDGMDINLTSHGASINGYNATWNGLYYQNEPTYLSGTLLSKTKGDALYQSKLSGTGFVYQSGSSASYTSSVGTGSVVLSTGATLTTPTLGVASATSISLTGGSSSNILSGSGSSITVGTGLTLSSGTLTSSGQTYYAGTGLTLTSGTFAVNASQPTITTMTALATVGSVTSGTINTTITPLASSTLAITGTTTVNGNNNFLTNISASSSTLTAVTFAYSNIPDGGQVSIDYLKTTASNTVLTFPSGTTISQSCNGIVSGLTLTLVSTTSGEFEITIIRRGSNYKVYCAQDVN